MQKNEKVCETVKRKGVSHIYALIPHRPGLPGWLSEMLKRQGPNRLAVQVLAWHEMLDYHAIATAVYAEAVGRVLDLQKKGLEWLTQAVFFHDCGKITCPSALVERKGWTVRTANSPAYTL
ncbi:hypothetical protein Desku_1506 [Desulfofundulus kuznetsovii DSM 6115]|uniref:Metal dependent phosphohydrolase n=2 Tax=Desulfofundulus kuznetsovii TaxID=58135 RepID=A0AAU8PMT4_DESK7|nr:hypothetical protein Desku_1506 [Desulfofundulus kuznetsovii DSM 6115]